MAQYIKQANVFGRLGTGIGKALSEQVPREVERMRLASGLNELGKQKDLSPFEQFSKLASIPGITPQMIQSGSDLLRQQARSQAMSNMQQDQTPTKPQEFPALPNQPLDQTAAKNPSITKGELLEDIQQGYIPPTIEERDAIASKAYNSNPAYFSNDPQKAIDWADAKIGQEEKRNIAKQAQHKTLTEVQDNVVQRLKAQSERLNTKIPADLYSTIEDKAIQATKPKKEGGRGLTEQQAIKEYAKEQDDASRLFSKIDEIGNWEIMQRPANETLRTMKNVQKEMEKIGQTDNFAKSLISRNKLSPQMAYSIAEPVNRIQDLNQTIKSLPSLEPVHTLFESKVPPDISVPKTLEVAPRLARFVKDNEKASPLAIANELEKKGYDPQTWLQYLTDHANELNLRQRQSDQASTPLNVLPTWNDWWLSAFSGLE